MNSTCEFKMHFNASMCVLPSTATRCSFCDGSVQAVPCAGYRQLVFMRKKQEKSSFDEYIYSICAQLAIPHGPDCPISRARPSSEMIDWQQTNPGSSAKRLKMGLLASKIADGESYSSLVELAKGFVVVPRLFPRIIGCK